MQNLKPIVKVSVKNLKDTIDSIYMFFENDKIINMIHAQKVANDFNLDIDILKQMTPTQRYTYVEEKITPLYNNKIEDLHKVIQTYQEFWDKNQTVFHKIFKEIFDIEYTGERICNCYVTINSVCPRYYETWSFDNSYTKTKELFIDNTIHELIHFFWFDLWKTVFPNWTEADFSAPSLGWAISELVIDALTKCTNFNNFTREKCAYEYFYDIEYKNKNLIEYIRNLFTTSTTIKNFMLEIYNLLTNNSDLTKKIIR